MSDRLYDVAVLGGGNAGLCAALTAREAGASVIVVESRAARIFAAATAGTRATSGAAHAAPTDVLTDAYSEDEFLSDLLRVTGDETDEALARLVVSDRPAAPSGCSGTASGSSRRSAARCTWRAPTRSSSAAARR